MRLSLAAAVCGSCVLLLAGCSGGMFTQLTQTTGSQPAGTSGAGSAGVRLNGSVFGGQQPIVGAHVYLMAAGTGGYGGSGIAASAANASASLLSAASTGTSDAVGAYVLTSASGTFTITGDYTCTVGQQVYVYALGGNPGSGTNSGAGLLAALGSCPAAGNFLATTPFISVNEVTTVAAAYAMAGFATDATHVSSSGTALAKVGIANAFANAGNLASLATGAALATTPAGNGTVPQAEINSLGNILAACVNSTGAGSSACTTLFSNALSGGATGTTPTDTATAAINIAHNPGLNITNLYALSTASPPFAPALPAQPTDFTVALSFTGGGISSPFSIAVDGDGNVWTTNSTSISKINGVTGAAISPAGGFTGNGLKGAFSIAIDPSGNAWVANVYTPTPPSTVSVFTTSGGVFTGSPFNGGGLSNQNSFNALSPRDIAFDAGGNAWIANLNGTATELNSASGAAISPSTGFPIGTSTNSESGVAVDSAGHLWVSGFGANVLYEMAVSNGATLGVSAYKAGGLDQPYSVAVDASNNVWLPDQFDPNSLVGFQVSKFTSVTTGAAFGGAGILGPDGVAIDGGGNVWVSNQIRVGSDPGAGLSELNNNGAAISPSTGYLSATLGSASDVAVDSSGNVWVANASVPVTFATSNYIIEFVGAAVPVVTPIATAVKNSTIGARP